VLVLTVGDAPRRNFDDPTHARIVPIRSGRGAEPVADRGRAPIVPTRIAQGSYPEFR
jgi:hypothetical protein